MNKNNFLPEEIVNRMFKERSLRTAITKGSHYLFFNFYFNHYVTSPTANFQREMFELTQESNPNLAVIVAFRGSGKSTIMTLSYPIWAILGKPQKKFVIILSQTQRQARQHLSNLKAELEANDLLRADLGPFEEDEEWQAHSLVIPKYGARIMTASSDQSTRGLRHGQYRPDLLICDDVEDLESVKTKEGRDKTHQWLTGEVIPGGDDDTKMIIVGNLLHEDSLLQRLRKGISDGSLNGIFRTYPIIDNDKILWPGKYPDMNAIERLKKKLGDEISWQREYMLKIISNADRVVHPEWIQHYDVIPRKKENYQVIATGIDLAVSLKDSADYTAMVSAIMHGDEDGNKKIYILPNPINQRLTFPETVDLVKKISKSIDPENPSTLYVEDVAYQKAFIQQMEDDGYAVEGVNVSRLDKRTRIALTTNFVKSGRILFPQKGTEDLIAQLTGFGTEKHDDLADAFSLLALQLIGYEDTTPRLTIINTPIGYRGGLSASEDSNTHEYDYD